MKENTFFNRGPSFQNPALDGYLEAQQIGERIGGVVTLTISVGTSTSLSNQRLGKLSRNRSTNRRADKQTRQSETANQIVHDLCNKKETKYYRFDVDTLGSISPDDWTFSSNLCGLSKSGSIHHIQRLTNEYLDRKETKKQMQAVADAIVRGNSDYATVSGLSNTTDVDREEPEANISQNGETENSHMPVETLVMVKTPKHDEHTSNLGR